MENQQPEKPKLNVSLKDAADIKCVQCEGKYFQPMIAFKKISGLMTGQPKPTIVPMEVFRCSDCGAVLEELLPKTN